VGIALPWCGALTGWLAVLAAWPREPGEARATSVLRALLACGLGIALVSSSWFVAVRAGVAASAPAVAVAMLSAAALAFAAIWWQRKRSPATATATARAPIAHGVDAGRLPRIAVALALAFALAQFVLVTLREPHGSGDALAVWNLRARLLAGGSGEWQRACAAYAPELDPGYPLMLPAFAAACWQGLGAMTPVVTAAVAFVCQFGLVALLAAALHALRGGRAACLGAAALLGFPAFVGAGPTQMADVPFAWFVLAGVVLLALHDGRAAPRAGRGLVVLAGALLGCAAWTKNEGLVPLVAVAVVRAWRGVRSRGWPERRAELGAYALGAAAPLAVLLAFKTGIASSNYFVDQMLGGSVVARVLDGERWLTIAGALGREAWALGPCLLLASVAWALVARRRALRWPLAAAGLVLLVYLATFLVTSHQLVWHLGTSLRRLLLHVLPVVLFAIFTGEPARDAAAGP
jgi:hypothetical protein